MAVNFRLLALQHLLGTAVLAALTLYLSLRFPMPAANRHLYVTLGLEAAAALAVLPFFRAEHPGVLAALPFALFVAALLAFLFYARHIIRELKKPRRRPGAEKRGHHS
jgi:hypothetical protein